MSRTLKYDIPGVDPRVSLTDIAEKGWSAIFARSPDESGTTPARRVLEIGFGRGEFLLAMAQRNPGVEFLGIEVSYKRTLKMARKVARAELANVRLVEAAAESALPNIIDPMSLDEIWINFSDPWPKVRHGHRRVLQSDFTKDAAVALAPHGVLHVATDDVPYAHQIDEVLSSEPRLRNLHAPWPFLPEVAGRTRTGYESQWRAEGRPIHFFAYASRPESSR